MGREFRQSEIISNLSQYVVDPTTETANAVVHDYAIILAQDCDLLWDYEARKKGLQGQLNGVLIYEAEDLLEEFKGKLPPGRDIWNRVRDNRDERYHVLGSVPPDCDLLGTGLPALAIDFKRFFTISMAEIERQLALGTSAKRRCRLEMPYREHLQTRAAFYFQRVMLPLPHLSV
jgi:hypothetical protein